MGDQEIHDENYTRMGEMDIPNDNSQFTYQMSNKLINQALEVLLGKNQVS